MSRLLLTEQIKAAHSKVKSGADFPAYIQDIKKTGVTFYETSLTDDHTGSIIINVKPGFNSNNSQTDSSSAILANPLLLLLKDPDDDFFQY